MNETGRSFRWTPRILGLLFVAYTSAESLIFGNLTETLIHMGPVFLPVLLAVLVGWWRPVAGSTCCLVLILGLNLFFHAYLHLVMFIVVTGPLAILGLLFLLQWLLERRNVQDKHA